MGQDLPSNVSLLVASLDLQLVRLLRGAIRAADQASRPAVGNITPAAVIEPRPRHRPDPLIEPRPRIRPTPRFEPRPVFHTTKRLEAALNDAARGAPAPDRCPPATLKSPFPPPWKVPPPDCVPAPRPLLKINTRRLDTTNKGSLVDTFM